MGKKFKASILLPVASILILFIASACSSGGSGSDVSKNPSGGSFGSIGILLKDAPADEFEHIYITITEISLLPGDNEEHPVVVFSSDEGYTIDLLDLRDQDFLLTLNEQVPTGTYTKVRMEISGINAVGGPCDGMDIDLPSGKIDINPQGSFMVEQGEVLYLRLDIDANKSINLHPAGKSGKCIFRPVVFAEVIPKSPAIPCSMLFNGTIESLIDLNLDTHPDGFILQRECTCQGDLTVKLDDSTLIFSEDNVYVDPDALLVNQQVEVYGYLDDQGALNAQFIIIGDVLVVEGNVLDKPTVDTIDIQPNPGEEISGDVNVSLSTQILILTLCGEDQTFDDIIVGSDVIVIGRYDTLGDTFDAVSILIRPAQP
jgi:hypothetical protein